MMLATDWPGVWPEFPQRLLSGAVAISGLFDLEPLTRAEFMRNDLRLDPVLARALSPAYLPWRNDVSMVRAVGAEESAEFHRQSTLMGAHWPLACERELIECPVAITCPSVTRSPRTVRLLLRLARSLMQSPLEFGSSR